MDKEICYEAIEAADEIDDAIEVARVSGNWDGTYTMIMATVDNAIRKAKGGPVCIDCTEHNTGDCNETFGPCGDFVLRSDLRGEAIPPEAWDQLIKDVDEVKYHCRDGSNARAEVKELSRSEAIKGGITFNKLDASEPAQEPSDKSQAEASEKIDEKWLARWFASKKRAFNVQMGLQPLGRPGDPIPPSHFLANYMGREIKKLFDEYAARPAPTAERGLRGNAMDDHQADILAVQVARLIERHVIDSRSPAADALLDYKGGRFYGPTAIATPESKE